MKYITSLDNAPVFSPIVSDFYSGMEVTVPMFVKQLNPGFGIEDIKNVYRQKYCDDIVKYVDSIDDGGFLSAGVVSGKDSMKISVLGNEERFILVALYDNLGKGASGAAVECMNLVLGVSKDTDLVI